MLLSFKINNYKSIKDLTVKLSYGEKKAPNGYKESSYLPFIEENKNRAVPCLAIYGPNASGKTNIIKAMDTFHDIVINQFNPSLSHPNIIQDCGLITSYSLSLVRNGKLIEYYLSHNSKEIVEEKLISNSKVIFSITHNNFFGCDNLKKVFEDHFLNKDKLFTKPFLYKYSLINDDCFITYSFILNNLKIHLTNHSPTDYLIENLANIKDKKALQLTLDRISLLLRKLDLGINKISYTNKDGKIKSYHLNSNKIEIETPFENESLGTKKVAFLIMAMLNALDMGSVLIIDKLGNSIHPILLKELILLFKDKRYNKNNAQLVFTSHDTEIMDHELMRVSEIGIVNKIKSKGTQFIRVVDFKGVRNVTRFRKQYLGGQFGGIPFSYI